jgi:hypothetical protein
LEGQDAKVALEGQERDAMLFGNRGQRAWMLKDPKVRRKAKGGRGEGSHKLLERLGETLEPEVLRKRISRDW